MGTIGRAIGMFAGTNIDDIILLTVLFLSARATGKPRPWQIWAGQYIGVSLLITISIVAALGFTITPTIGSVSSGSYHWRSAAAG